MGPERVGWGSDETQSYTSDGSRKWGRSGGYTLGERGPRTGPLAPASVGGPERTECARQPPPLGPVVGLYLTNRGRPRRPVSSRAPDPTGTLSWRGSRPHAPRVWVVSGGGPPNFSDYVLTCRVRADGLVR